MRDNRPFIPQSIARAGGGTRWEEFLLKDARSASEPKTPAIEKGHP